MSGPASRRDRTDRTITRNSSRSPGLEPALLMVFRCDRPLAPVVRWRLGALSSVAIGRGTGGHATVPEGGGTLRVRFDDPTMSSRHARLDFVLGEWVLADEGAKNPTLLHGARVERRPLADADVFQCGGTVFLYRASVVARGDATREVDPRSEGAMGTLLLGLEEELARLVVVARSGLAVLVGGASGAGKSHLARALHDASARSGPFVSTRGARLDRKTIDGARGGTLHVDVESLGAEEQALLLAAMEAEDRPAGDPARLSVIGTHRGDLATRVANGSLRADLHARLSAYPFTLPPLRERPEDLGLLVGALIPSIAPDAAGTLRFDRAAALALFRSAWPHNVHGLRNTLAAAVALAKGGVVRIEHLPETLRAMPAAKPIAEATTDEAPKDGLRLTREGDYWTVAWRGVLLRQKDAVGVRYLAHLVERPGVEVHAATLVRVVRKAGPDETAADVAEDHAGPMLDEAAKAAYRRRIEDLRDTIEEAKGFGDRERAARAEAELDAISRELARAVGLGGRDRKASAAAERLRVSVTVRLRKAIEKIHEGSAALGDHLAASVRTGAFCAYEPR